MSKQEEEDTKDGDDTSPNFIAAASTNEIKNALYARCANLGAEKIYTQRDLLAFKIIPNDDLNELLSCTRQLTIDGLFKLMTKDGKACWKVVKKEDAAKYVQSIISTTRIILIRLSRIGTNLLVQKRLWFTPMSSLLGAKVHGSDYFGHVPTCI